MVKWQISPIPGTQEIFKRHMMIFQKAVRHSLTNYNYYEDIYTEASAFIDERRVLP